MSLLTAISFSPPSFSSGCVLTDKEQKDVQSVTLPGTHDIGYIRSMHERFGPHSITRPINATRTWHLTFRILDVFLSDKQT